MKRKRKRKSARKTNHNDVLRDLSGLASPKARLKRLLAETKLHDGRPPTRAKSEPNEKRGLGPVHPKPSPSTIEQQRKKIMRPLDPEGERRRDYEDLWAEHRAIRKATAAALARADAQLPRAPKRPRRPRRTTRPSP